MADAPGKNDTWDRLAEEFLRSSQEDDDRTAVAEVCKSETCSITSQIGSEASQESSSHGRSPQPVSWWAKLLKLHTQAYEVPSQVRPVRIVSACAGIFTEGESLKARDGFQ